MRVIKKLALNVVRGYTDTRSCIFALEFRYCDLILDSGGGEGWRVDKIETSDRAT